MDSLAPSQSGSSRGSWPRVRTTSAAGPKIVTEWSVEPRAEATCRVRVVHGWTSENDDFDQQFEASPLAGSPTSACSTSTWRVQRPACAAFPAHGRGAGAERRGLGRVDRSPRPDDRQSQGSRSNLGPALDAGREGRQRRSPARAGRKALLVLKQPAPGIAHLVPHPMEGQVFLTIRFYLFGERAARPRNAERTWQEWLGERFAQSERVEAKLPDV